MRLEIKNVDDARAQQRAFHYYESAKNDRFATVYATATSQHEWQSFTQQDRLKVIAASRKFFRDSPILKGLARVFVSGAGIPIHKITTKDEAYNKLKENFLYRKFRNCLLDENDKKRAIRNLLTKIYYELFLCGEVFAVELVGGKIKLVPSELCGSNHAYQVQSFVIDGKPYLERDGIGYDQYGNRAYYRFGVRDQYGNISYDIKDGASLIRAENVHHLGFEDRIEQSRYVPLLLPCLKNITIIDDTILAKLSQFKLNASIGMIVEKQNLPEDYNVLEGYFNDTKDITGGIGSETVKTGNEAGASTAIQVREAIVQEMIARTPVNKVPIDSTLILERGETAKIIQSNSQAQDFDAYVCLMLDLTCAAIGIPAEEAIVGYRRSNYSSARATKLSWKNTVDSIRAEVTPLLDRMQENFSIIGEAFDELPALPEKASHDDIEWVFPAIKEIDEYKAAIANRLMLEDGSKDIDTVCAELGYFGADVEDAAIKAAGRRAKKIKEIADTMEISSLELMQQLPRKQPVAINVVENNPSQNDGENSKG